MGAVACFGAELVEESVGVKRHELVPLSLSDGSDPLTHCVGSASKPPCKSMIKTVSVAWHANDGSRMRSLSESAISTVGVWHEDVSLKQRGKRPEEKHPGWPSESGTAGHYVGT